MLALWVNRDGITVFSISCGYTPEELNICLVLFDTMLYIYKCCVDLLTAGELRKWQV